MTMDDLILVIAFTMVNVIYIRPSTIQLILSREHGVVSCVLLGGMNDDDASILLSATLGSSAASNEESEVEIF